MGLGAARKEYTAVAATVFEAVNGVIVEVPVTMQDWELTSENRCSKTSGWYEQKDMAKIQGRWYATKNSAAGDKRHQDRDDRFTLPGSVPNEGDYTT